MWQYDGVVRESLVRYKFWHRRSYGRTYGRELAKKMREWKISYDVISWVPVSSLRKISRGYDQVAIIADNMGKQLGQKPVRLLKKCRNNRKQSTIQGIENRKKNVEGVYRVANNADIKGKQVLLLDDIITTGATISEAAAVLKKAGAKEVHAVCVAVANKYHK